jgi:hypothetical protein
MAKAKIKIEEKIIGNTQCIEVKVPCGADKKMLTEITYRRFDNTVDIRRITDMFDTRLNKEKIEALIVLLNYVNGFLK